MLNTNSEDKSIFQRMYAHVLAFGKIEAAGGICLMLAMMAAMLVENSPLSGLYESFLNLEGELRIGNFQIEKPLVIWVNDLWMAVFFFLVGLEIKSELKDGHLRDRSSISLPLVAALGGMVVPALLYYMVNRHDEQALYGWAIPMATDIAFALGVLSLLGSKVPLGARIFLMTLAIIDDLGAIIVIALFYTSNLSLVSLLSAACMIAILVAMNRKGVKAVAPYLIVGLLLWICVLKSGVHATLAGVITALCIPWQGLANSEDEPVNKLIDDLHPSVAFLILPAFAFVNTGINFSTIELADVMGSVPVGIVLGLFVGKQIGVFGFAWIGLKLGIGQKPEGVSILQLYGVSVLCGIGFTMSLFIGGLAFEDSGMGTGGADRLAILIASLLSAVLGYLIFRFSGTTGTQDSID